MILGLCILVVAIMKFGKGPKENNKVLAGAHELVEQKDASVDNLVTKKRNDME